MARPSIMHNDPSRPSTLQIGGRTYPIIANTALASTSNRSACTCEFLSFGAWASSVPDPRNNGKTYTAFGTYVAGTPSRPTADDGQRYLQRRHGRLRKQSMARSMLRPAPIRMPGICRLAPATSTATSTAEPIPATGATGGDRQHDFRRHLHGGSRSGSLNGSFFASPSDAAAYQAGTFSIGSGVPATRRRASSPVSADVGRR